MVCGNKISTCFYVTARLADEFKGLHESRIFMVFGYDQACVVFWSIASLYTLLWLGHVCSADGSVW